MIREVTTSDLVQIEPIEQACFTPAWTKEQFLYEMQENPFAHVMLLEEAEVVGFIDYWITFETCQLAQIAISPKQRRKGYAKQLMETMIQAAEEAMCENISLEVRVSNEEAITLYERYGFMEINRKKGYYHDGEDAVFMMKPLGGNW